MITGIFGLIITTASSMYVALRLGALPWPTVFVTVLAMTVLSRFKNSSLNEINVSHTLMSAGSMVAGGLAFTIPGIWIMNPQADVSLFSVMAVAISGAVLGTLFSWLFRKNLIEDRNLAFPIGEAAYQTLINGTSKGKQAVKLFVAMGFSIVFSLFRDAFGIIPSVVTLFAGSALIEPVTMWLSPMALSIGAVIDEKSVAFWAGGAVLGYFVLAPLGVAYPLRQNLAIGIMLGTGLGILIKVLFSKIKEVNVSERKIEKNKIALSFTTVIAISFFLAVSTEITFPEALLVCLGVALVSLLSGLLTGQSGINPMEVFGIIITLAVSFVFKSGKTSMFLMAGTVAVACGLSGDVMNDFKSGHLLKTDPDSQIIAEGIGGVAGAILSTLVLFAMRKSFGQFGTELLPAPQAKAVYSMIGGSGNTPILILGMLIGCIITLCGLPGVTLAGLGMYLSTQITTTICLGAVIAAIAKKTRADEHDVGLVANGFLGGEGITGVVSAIVSMF